MKAFKIGFVLTLSFLIFLGIISCSFGFFPAPVGPKAPAYPSYSYPQVPLLSSSGDSSQTASSAGIRSSYDEQMVHYQADLKKYQEEQKIFIQNKIIPYAQGMFTGWVAVLVVLGIIGILMAKYASELIGGALMFTGVWAAFVGPLGGIFWFINSLVSGFAKQAEAEYSVQPIFQIVGLVTIMGAIVLILLGTFLFPKEKIFKNI